MIALLDIIQHIDVTTQHAMEWTEPEEMMSKNTMQIRLGVGHRNKLADLLWCSLYLQQSLEGVVMVIINRSSCLDNLWCNTWRIHLSHVFLSTPHPTLSLPQNNFSLHLLVKVIISFCPLQYISCTILCPKIFSILIFTFCKYLRV